MLKLRSLKQTFYLFPLFNVSKASLMCSSCRSWVMNSSSCSFWSMYWSTSLGTSWTLFQPVEEETLEQSKGLYLTIYSLHPQPSPPKYVPFRVRPISSFSTRTSMDSVSVQPAMTHTPQASLVDSSAAV